MGLGTISRTVGQLQTALNRQFGDESAVQVALTDVVRWINQAQLEIVKDNNILRSTGTVDLVAGTYAISLATLNVLTIKALHLNGAPIRFVPFEQYEQTIQKNDPLRTNVNTPTMWTEWAGTLYLYPTPSTSYPGGLTVYFQQSPADISSASDKLSVPDIYFNAVLQYCLQQAYELDENWSGSQVKAEQFQSSIMSLAEKGSSPSSEFYPMPTISPGDDGSY